MKTGKKNTAHKRETRQQQASDRLDTAHHDLADFLAASQIACIRLDAEQRIQQCTDAAARLLRLTAADIGRPFDGLLQDFEGGDLLADVRRVMREGDIIERDLRHADGPAYLMRIFPYPVSADRIAGAVLTFTDVSRLRHKNAKDQRVAELSEAMNRINKLLHSLLDKGQILQQVLEAGAEALASDSAALSLREGEAWTVRYVYGMPDDLIGRKISDEQDPHALVALKTRHPVAISNCQEDERCNAEHMRAHNIGAVLVIPIVVPVQPLGVVFFNYHGEPHLFSDEEIHFGQQIGATASAAMANAQMFDEITATAEALRESEARLQETMRAGELFTCEWAPESDVMQISDNSAAILGIEASTGSMYARATYMQNVHAEDRASLTNAIRDVRPDAPTYEHQYRFVRNDGRCLWLEESGRAEFDAAGRIVRIRCVIGDITPRMEAMRRERELAVTLAASQSALEIVDAMGEGIVLFRMDGTVTEINPAIETFTQLSRKDIVGKNLRALLPSFLAGPDVAEMERAVDAALRGDVRQLPPLTIENTSDTRIVVSPSFALITASAGRPASVVLTLQDVTALYQQSELLNQIFDTTHMQIVCLDEEFRFLRVNRAYAAYFGQEAAHFVGKSYFACYPYKATKETFAQVRRTGEVVSEFEIPFVPEDDPETVTYWDFSLRPMYDRSGQQDGFLLCLLDVTERVESRQKLVANEQKYQELVQNANSIIMRVTPDQRITFFNEYAQHFFGYSEAEVLGRSIVGTIVPEIDSEGHDLQKMAKEIAAAPETHRSNENENMCKDGRRVRVHWSNRALRDEKGNVRELLCVGTDLTDCWRLQKQADAYRNRLQALANRLTNEEEASRRHIASDIHDTVVQTISLANMRLGGVMAAMDKAGLPDQRKNVEAVRQMLEQGNAECRGLMESLVPSLLYEAGLGAALRHFAEEQVARTEGVRILVETEDHCDATMDDALRGLLFQCARELIMNAMKYAGSCEIRVILSFPAEQVELRVQDNGRGFDSVAIEEKSHENGGGFGLFNIRERLRNLGGKLAIESEVGRGTTATIRVPMA